MLQRFILIGVLLFSISACEEEEPAARPFPQELRINNQPYALNENVLLYATLDSAGLAQYQLAVYSAGIKLEAAQNDGIPQFHSGDGAIFYLRFYSEDTVKPKAGFYRFAPAKKNGYWREATFAVIRADTVQTYQELDSGVVEIFDYPAGHTIVAELRDTSDNQVVFSFKGALSAARL
jgi:hypothetical protein